MKKLSTVLPLTIVVVVLAYFVFKIAGPYINPCESMVQETSTSINAKLKFIKTNASFALNENKLNDLSDQTELTAYNLKSCCIGGAKGFFKEDESFAKCLNDANSYNIKLQSAIDYIKLAEAARNDGNSQVEQENVQKVNQVLGYSYQLERSYNNAADALSNVADQISGANN